MSAGPADTRAMGCASILSLGEDWALLESRQLLLQSVGYRVVSMPGDTTLKPDDVRGFQLFLLCHSIEGPALESLVASLRNAAPSTPILQLTRFDSAPAKLNDRVVPACSGPSELLRTIDAVLGGRVASARRLTVQDEIAPGLPFAG